MEGGGGAGGRLAVIHVASIDRIYNQSILDQRKEGSYLLKSQSKSACWQLSLRLKKS